MFNGIGEATLIATVVTILVFMLIRQVLYRLFSDLAKVNQTAAQECSLEGDFCAIKTDMCFLIKRVSAIESHLNKDGQVLPKVSDIS